MQSISAEMAIYGCSGFIVGSTVRHVSRFSIPIICAFSGIQYARSKGYIDQNSLNSTDDVVSSIVDKTKHLLDFNKDGTIDAEDFVENSKYAFSSVVEWLGPCCKSFGVGFTLGFVFT